MHRVVNDHPPGADHPGRRQGDEPAPRRALRVAPGHRGLRQGRGRPGGPLPRARLDANPLSLELRSRRAHPYLRLPLGAAAVGGKRGRGAQGEGTAKSLVRVGRRPLRRRSPSPDTSPPSSSFLVNHMLMTTVATVKVSHAGMNIAWTFLERREGPQVRSGEPYHYYREEKEAAWRGLFCISGGVRHSLTLASAFTVRL